MENSPTSIWNVSHSDGTIKSWLKSFFGGVEKWSEMKWASLWAVNATESVKKVCFFRVFRFTQIINSRKEKYLFHFLHYLDSWFGWNSGERERKRKKNVEFTLKLKVSLYCISWNQAQKLNRRDTQVSGTTATRWTKFEIDCGKSKKRRVGKRRRKGERKNVENFDEIGGNRIIFHIKHSNVLRDFRGRISSTVNWLKLIPTLALRTYIIFSFVVALSALAIDEMNESFLCLSWANVNVSKDTKANNQHENLFYKTCRSCHMQQTIQKTTKRRTFLGHELKLISHFSVFLSKIASDAP